MLESQGLKTVRCSCRLLQLQLVSFNHTNANGLKIFEDPEGKLPVQVQVAYTASAPKPLNPILCQTRGLYHASIETSYLLKEALTSTLQQTSTSSWNFSLITN